MTDEERKEQDKKNKDFVQFYRPFMDEITRLAREQPRAFDLFMLISKHMDGMNALCVSQQALTELLGFSRQTVSKATKYLKDNGWMCVLKSGSSNVYIINPRVAWTSYDNQKQYCKFQSNVLLSASENNEYLKSSQAFSHFKTVDTEFVDAMQRKHDEFEKQCEIYKAI